VTARRGPAAASARPAGCHSGPCQLEVASDSEARISTRSERPANWKTATDFNSKSRARAGAGAAESRAGVTADNRARAPAVEPAVGLSLAENVFPEFLNLKLGLVGANSSHCQQSVTVSTRSHAPAARAGQRVLKKREMPGPGAYPGNCDSESEGSLKSSCQLEPWRKLHRSRMLR
jgi:hypothetical protein